MAKNTDTASDLRKVYLHVYGSFATDPSEVASQFKDINLRYARELLATLVEAELVAKGEGDEGDVWQTYPDTHDNMTDADAEARIDGWLAENMDVKPAKAPKPPKSPEVFRPCYCGCGENVPSKSFYRPGHDARHAGVIGRIIASNAATPGYDRRDALNDLPSDKLQAKAEAIAEKAIAKVDAKLAKEVAKQAAKDAAKAGPVEGTVKVGKGEYVAAKHADGTVTYFDAKGKEQIASKTAAATFVE